MARPVRPRGAARSRPSGYFEQSFFVLDKEIFVFLALVAEFKRLYIRTQAFAGIALEEAFAVDPRGQRNRLRGRRTI